ncbi:hypothetical protein CLV56_1252 [Mumia flava]|uniref:Sodium:proton antiporter n=1 Tax=Mumia flava TaxID=1348852 RepID=A0A0B2BPQ8_9ACTN|nr:DUF6328 family protein [Mumia flava]PJJ57033.1 hypothetical protein CLV56_1252 [Mumia flava]
MSSRGVDPSIRPESAADRLTRNWNELLQELRVAQTGVQILTAFLLTLPFTSRFGELTDTQKNVFLAVLSCSVAATALLIAPVALHRALFRRGQRPWLVGAAHVCAAIGLGALVLTVSGAMWLVFDVVAGRTAAWWAIGGSLVVFTGLWVVLPAVNRLRH